MSSQSMVAARPQRKVRFGRRKRAKVNVRLSMVICMLIPLALVVFVFALAAGA